MIPKVAYDVLEAGGELLPRRVVTDTRAIVCLFSFVQQEQSVFIQNGDSNQHRSGTVLL
jgi:hypothetical protein